MSRFMNRSPASSAAAGPGSVNSADSGVGTDQPKQGSSFSRHFRTSSSASNTTQSGFFGRSPVSPSFPTTNNAQQQFNPIAFPSAVSSKPSNPAHSSPGLPVVSLKPPRDQALSLDSHRTDMPSFFHLPGRRSAQDRASPISEDFTPTISLNTPTVIGPGFIVSGSGITSVGMEKTRSKSPPPAEASASVKRFHTLSYDHPPARLQNRNRAGPLASPELNAGHREALDRAPDMGIANVIRSNDVTTSQDGAQPPRRLGPARSYQTPSSSQRHQMGVAGFAIGEQDSYAVDDMSEHLEEYGDALGFDGSGAREGFNAADLGLHRQRSLPSRGPITFTQPPPANAISRKSSRNSRHPSISEDGPSPVVHSHGLVSTYGSALTSPIIGSGLGLGPASSGGGLGLSSQTSPILGGKSGMQGDGDISRSNSLRQVMENAELLQTDTVSVGNEPLTHHHRSYSHSNSISTQRPAPGPLGRISSPPVPSSLHKSPSLRTTVGASIPPLNGSVPLEVGAKLSHSNSLGHAHTRSLYALSDASGDPPLSANAALTPTSFALWESTSAIPMQGHTGIDGQSQVEADGVRRAHSLNQRHGHGDQNRDRVVRSSGTAVQPTRREKEFTPMDPWKERTSIDDDGWAEFEQLRNGQAGADLDLNLSPQVSGLALPLRDSEPQEGAYQQRLRQAFDAMQLGTQMMQAGPEGGRGNSGLETGFGAFEPPAPGIMNYRSGQGSRLQNGFGLTAEASAVAYNNLLQQQVAQQQEQLQQQQQMLLAASGMLQQYNPNTYGNPLQMSGGGMPGVAPSTFMTAGAAGILPSSLWSMSAQPSLAPGAGPNITNIQHGGSGFRGPSRPIYPGPPQHATGNRYGTPQQQHGYRGTNTGVPGLSLPTSAQRAAASAPRAPDSRPPVTRVADKQVKEMIESRGLNPGEFQCAPERARFFVIKSFTEDDVQKSLKHEIWSSTSFGNKRLDTAFQEATGPVFLFFSVNGSGHFCGVAEMLTRVDYNKSADVWAQDGKWKGVFTLKWIFVKDIPNGVLRHIRLTNTTEQKPITNSRDTQELTYEAGSEVLRIFLGFRQKTSLLEDFGYYEMQAASKAVSPPITGEGPPSTAPGPNVPEASAEQIPAAVPGLTSLPPRNGTGATITPSSNGTRVVVGGAPDLNGPALQSSEPAVPVTGSQSQTPQFVDAPMTPTMTPTANTFGRPPGFSKGFNASGPPSLTNGGRFAVVGGSKNGVSSGTRGVHGR